MFVEAFSNVGEKCSRGVHTSGKFNFIKATGC